MAKMPSLLDLAEQDRRRSELAAMRAFTTGMIAPSGRGSRDALTLPPPRQAAGTPTAGYDMRAPVRQAAGTPTAGYDMGMPAQPASAPMAAPMQATPAPAPQQQRGLLGGLFGPEGRDARARLAIALEGMTLNPNQALIGQLQQGIEGRATEKQRNATIEWLLSRGHDDLAAALEAGAEPQAVLAEATRRMQPADPLDAIRLETAQIQLQRLKSGADMDPNVQSSAPLPDQSGVVLTMRDGSVQVRTVGGQVLGGQDAMDFVRAAQENAAQYQRSIYSARREGTLGADIGLGEEASAAGARGTEIGKAQGAAIVGAPIDVAAADTTLQYISEIRTHPGLDVGTGGTSVFNAIPGTPGFDFQTRLDQLLSGGFLTAIDQLRGMGALSNAEGQTATRAISRMNAATSKPEFLDALAAYESEVRKGRERAAARLPQAGVDVGGAPDVLSQEDLKYLE